MCVGTYIHSGHAGFGIASFGDKNDKILGGEEAVIKAARGVWKTSLSDVPTACE